jgi:hypothetical protein
MGMKTLLYVGLAMIAASWACSGGTSADPGGSSGQANGGADGGTGPDGATVTPNGVTYYKDLLPILQDHCQKCHTEGGIAPFTLTSYDDAKGQIGMMVDATSKGVMPPWGAQNTPECAPPRPWKDDMRLSDAQIATIKAWRDGGTVEGDPKDAPPPRAADPTDLAGKNFTATNKPFAIQTTTSDTFRCFVIDPQLTARRYYNGSFFVPGNKQIVHHILLFTDATGESAKLADANGQYDCFGGPGFSDPGLLAAWAPGGVPTELPSNAGAALDPGTKLVMQIHYHPHGQDFSPDATTLQLRLIDTAPEYAAVVRLIGNFSGPIGSDGLLPGPDDNGAPVFRIPANVSGHTETMRITFPSGTPSPLYVYGMGAHMHLVGTDEKVTIDHASGGTDCMLQVPSWNFNWQRFYTYDTAIEQLPTVAVGDKMTVRCTYDNTMANTFLATELSTQGKSAPHDVVLGETTDDEMCLGAAMFLYKAK